MNFSCILTLNCTNIFVTLAKFDTKHRKPACLHLPELGYHQLVKLRIASLKSIFKHLTIVFLTQCGLCVIMRLLRGQEGLFLLHSFKSYVGGSKPHWQIISGGLRRNNLNICRILFDT